MHQSLNTKDLLSATVVLYRNNILLFLGISILGALFGVLPIFLAETKATVLSYFGILISLWVWAALILVASKRYLNEKATISSGLISIKEKYWAFIGVTGFVILISLVGYLVLIIPGIYLATILGFAPLSVIIEGASQRDYLRFSRKLIKGYFWPSFLFYTAMWIPCALSMLLLMVYTLNDTKLFVILSQILWAIVMPFLTAGQVLLYHKLKIIKSDEVASFQDNNKSRHGCLVTGGLIIALIVLSGLWLWLFMSFIHSGTGSGITQKFIANVSPPIVFPEGVSLARPNETLVMKLPKQQGYSITQFKRRKGLSVQTFIYLYSLKELELNKQEFDLSNETLIQKIVEHEDNFLTRTMMETFETIEAQSNEQIILNQRAWGVAILVGVNESENEYHETIRKIYYTPVGEKVLIVDFMFLIKANKEADNERIQTELEVEELGAVDLLKTIKFTENANSVVQ